VNTAGVMVSAMLLGGTALLSYAFAAFLFKALPAEVVLSRLT
jgi:hypothetical protein